MGLGFASRSQQSRTQGLFPSLGFGVMDIPFYSCWLWGDLGQTNKPNTLNCLGSNVVEEQTLQPICVQWQEIFPSF